MLVISGKQAGLVPLAKLTSKNAHFSTEMIVQTIDFSKTAQIYHAHHLASVMQSKTRQNVIKVSAQLTLMSVTSFLVVTLVIVHQVSLVMDILAEI